MQDGNENISTAKAIKFGRIIAKIALVCVFAIVAFFASFYTLDEQHAAVITTFGKAEMVTETGPHFRIPFIQRLKTVETTVKGMAIGYDLESNEDIVNESIMISSDYNFLNVDFYLTYQVTDPIKYLYAADNPEAMLKSLAQTAIRNTIASYKVDAVLTTGKNEIQSNIKALLKEQVDVLDIGLSVNNITIQDAEPPTEEIKNAFKQVEDAKQGKETAMNNANKYRNEQIPAMEATVNKITQDAEAQKQARIAEAESQVARFNAMYDEYVKNPYTTRERMFYETMESLLPNMKVIIQGDGNKTQTVLPLDKFSDVNVETTNNSETTAE